MIRILAAVSTVTVLLCAAGSSQTPPSHIVFINRLNSAYRSLQSFTDTAIIKYKAAGKELTGNLRMAILKPNKYAIELKGDYLNTQIVSDGTSITAFRPDKKVFTKTKSPSQIIKTDLIGDVDMPSPGARIIAQLLAGNGREGAMGQILMSGRIAGPEKLGKGRAYVLTLPYGEETEAKVYIGVDDYLIRQVKLVKGEVVEWLEEHTPEIHKSIDPALFSLTLPEGVKQVASLPQLEKPVEVAAKDESGNSDKSDPSDSGKARLIAQGQNAFRSSGCGNCHRMGGQGGRNGPDLSRAGATRTRERIIQYVRNPRAFNANARMPGFGGRISDSDLQALADFLAGLK